MPIENSLLFFSALQAAGVPVEMHLYERGAAWVRHATRSRHDVWLDRSLVRLDARARLAAGGSTGAMTRVEFCS